MKRDLHYIALITFIALFWFAGVYFAVVALFPEFALACGLLAAMFAVVVYLMLWLARRDEAGLPIGLLSLFPVICITAGALWWGLRLVGLWPPRR